MVERAVGARLAHVLYYHWYSFRRLSFHVIQEGQVVVVLLFLLYGVSLCVLCFHVCADLFSVVSAGLRISVQSLHSLEEPPIARLSASLSLPCAFAASSVISTLCDCWYASAMSFLLSASFAYLSSG